MKNSEMNLYMELSIINDFIKDENSSIKKQAQSSFIMPLVDSVKGYFSNHFDDENKTDSVINMLAPGAISVLLRSLNFPWIGALLGLLVSTLHIDIAGLLESFLSKAKSLVSSGRKIASSEIDSIISDVSNQFSSKTASNHLTSFSLMKSDVRIVKMAIMNPEIVKNSQLKVGEKAINIFLKIIGWVVKTIIASAGLMVAGDAVNKMIGAPNGFDNKTEKGLPVQELKDIETIDNKSGLKLNPSYKNIENADWTENVKNNDSEISNLLVRYARSVYDLNNFSDSEIRNTVGFNVVKNKILDFNEATPNANLIFIPKIFKTKKQIVDLFVSELAHNKT